MLMANCSMRHERRTIDMNPCRLVRKAESGSGSDTLPTERGECTPVEIKSSVFEAGTLCVATYAANPRNEGNLVGEANDFSHW